MSTDTQRLLIAELRDRLAEADAARQRSGYGRAQQATRRAAIAALRLARATSEPQLKARRLGQAEQLRRLAAKEPDVQIPEGCGREESTEKRGSSGSFAALGERPNARFTDVVGLEDAKREIRERMILPFSRPAEARALGVRPGGGLLLYGPPGTGKTLLARATAGELEAAFFHVTASQVMSQWVGVAEQRVTELFAAARAHPRSVVFIDEVDALLPRRSGNASTVMARVVPQFLAEMDGFERHPGALLIIGATNEPDRLDPAALRPGRLDIRILVDLPGTEAREAILRGCLAHRLTSGQLDLRAVAERTEGYSCADLAGLCDTAARRALSRVSGPACIDQALLIQVLEETPASVNAAERRRYARRR